MQLESLHQTNRSIGERLKAFRKARGWSQESMSFEISLTRDQLASVETGRAALLYRTAYSIHSMYGVSLWWLATGEGDVRDLKSVQFPLPELREFGPRATLANVAAAVRKYLETEPESPPTWIDSHRLTFFRQFLYGLDVPDSSQSRLERLLSRVRKHLPKRGGQAALAREFRVSRQSVSSWFAGDSAPEAETVLRLLEWVIMKEQPIKTPGAGTNNAEGKQTRLSKTRESKTKSDPPS